MGNNNEYDPDVKHEGENVSGPFVPAYAGFWIRLVAYIIDAFVLGLVSMIIVIPMVFVMVLFTASSSTNNDTANTGLGATFCCVYCLTIIVSLVAQWLYFAWFESSKYMGTPGKVLLGLAVTDMNGDRISFGKATLRYVSKLLTNIILFIGYIVIAFSPKKQGLYDMIAQTLVIKK